MSAAALDPSYAQAARRKAGAEVRAGRSRVSFRLLAGLVAVGLGTGVAAAQARQRAGETGLVRRSLLSDVQQDTATTDRLADLAAGLRTQVSRIRDQALRDDVRGRAMADQVAALELATGAVAVHGPALEVTLDDAKRTTTAGAARGGQLADGRIYDTDVQAVVNALWLSGAEAISVNDQRITAQSAIRSAGEAVLVDLRPLSPPYVLRAVGDLNRMEPTFVDGPTARRYQTWTSLYGLTFRVHRVADAVLPAASAPDLRVARPVPSPGGPS